MLSNDMIGSQKEGTYEAGTVSTKEGFFCMAVIVIIHEICVYGNILQESMSWV